MKNSDKLCYSWPPFNKAMLKVMKLILDLRKHNIKGVLHLWVLFFEDFVHFLKK